MSIAGSLRDVARDVLLNGLIALPVVPHEVRWLAFRAIGMDAGRCRVAGRYFFGGRAVAIGSGAFINYGAFIDTSAKVTIGRNCSLGPQVTIITGTHRIDSAVRRAGPADNRPVVIGDGAWIGARVTILPGVTVGPGAVVGAGALVMDDCDANSVYVGAPARKVRTLDPDQRATAPVRGAEDGAVGSGAQG